jgi:Cu+-exporting ATPase
MHPQVRQSAPGRCPLCGMDLVPADGALPAHSDAPVPAMPMHGGHMHMHGTNHKAQGVSATSPHHPMPMPAQPPAPHTQAAAGKPDSSKTTSSTGTVWTCPMHPQIRRDAPGACPICGMALEPLLPSADAPKATRSCATSPAASSGRCR